MTFTFKVNSGGKNKLLTSVVLVTVFWKRETFCVASEDRVKLITRELSGRHKSTWFEAEPHCNKLTQVEGVALEGSECV